MCIRDSDEDLCEVASSSERLVKHSFEDRCFDEIGEWVVGDCHGVCQNFRPIMPPSTPPAMPAPAALSLCSPPK